MACVVLADLFRLDQPGAGAEASGEASGSEVAGGLGVQADDFDDPEACAGEVAGQFAPSEAVDTNARNTTIIGGPVAEVRSFGDSSENVA